jgi:hypothetical protein
VSPVANALADSLVTFGVVPLALSAIVLPIDALWIGAHAVFAALMIALDALAVLPAAARNSTHRRVDGGCCLCRRRHAVAPRVCPDARSASSRSFRSSSSGRCRPRPARSG